MTSTTPVHPSDLLGFSRLAGDGTARLADLVEAMHNTVARATGSLDGPALWAKSSTTPRVYETVRAVTRVVGSGIDAILAPLVPMLGERPLSPEREAVLAALNGLIGDYLAATDNPLAIAMRLRRHGQPFNTRAADAERRDSPAKRQAVGAGAWPLYERSSMDAGGAQPWRGGGA